ncbi:MAG: DNA primase [Candidatus Eremiobacteraeota bacterium]|nr:DNA primase [Candidatus Eremiobacteraeota bacterium]
MAFDLDTVKREIHARVDIATFIGSYVPLKKRGRDLVGLCPFHAEKTPSFHVHPEEGYFKCFGCDAAGDVISFVMRHENVPFVEAVHMLANKAGIELPEETAGSRRVRSEREVIYAANRLASAFFVRSLAGPQGAAARAYCAKRGLTPATLERFAIGFAPDAWEALCGELQSNGIDLRLAERAGLVKTGQRGFRDFYRNRLMIPTYATTGEIIAFGGRALDDVPPKYLNTQTTPVYVKGRHLYALNVARRAAAKDGTLIVVEGYLDCIALHQAGFENAVASLGTSFTPEQAAELRKYAERIFLCFDGDLAGNAAADKAVDVAVKSIEHAGSTVRIVTLPPGQDPDSYVREHGAEGFAQLLESAKPSIEFRLDREIARLQSGFDSPAVLARKGEELIRAMTAAAEWDRWRVYVAQRLKVNVNELRNSRFFATPGNFGPRTGTRHAPAAPAQALSFEREVLGIFLEEPALLEEYGAAIPAERFKNDLYRSVYQRLFARRAGLATSADIFALFAEDDTSVDLLSSLRQRERSSTVRYADSQERRSHLDQIVMRLQLEDEQQRYWELSRAIDELVDSNRTVPADLRSEFDALVAKLKR